MPIIVKNEDRSVSIIHPNQKKYGEGKRPYSEYPTLTKESVWFWTDQKIDKSDLESRAQLYWDGESVKKDIGWDVAVMPVDVLCRKHRSRCDKKLDDELAKEAPDPIKIAKIQREKEKCLSWTDKEWYQQALKNMDEDGHDKKLIRKKLKEKLEA